MSGRMKCFSLLFFSATWLTILFCGAVEAGYTVLITSQWKNTEGGNNHWYSLVEFDSGNISWDSAKAFSEGATYNGISGHLATFTSEGEWSFVRDNLLEPNRREFDQAWLGATDRDTEGDWKWVTGESFSFMDPANFDNLNDEDFLAAWRFGVSDPLQWNDINSFTNLSNRAVFEFSGATAVPEPSTLFLSLVGVGSTGFLHVRRRRIKKSIHDAK